MCDRILRFLALHAGLDPLRVERRGPNIRELLVALRLPADGERAVYTLARERVAELVRAHKGQTWREGDPTTGRIRSATEIIERYSIPHRYGRILYRFAKRLGARRIVEMGSAFGIGSLYLASAAEFVGIEVDPSYARIANESLAAAGLPGRVEVGRIEEVFPAIAREAPFDFAFVDAIHQYPQTLGYFRLLERYCPAGAVAVFDDIDMREGMRRAWADICRSERVTDAIGLRRRLGCVVIRPTVARR